MFGHSAMMIKRGCYLDTGDLASGAGGAEGATGEVATPTDAGAEEQTGDAGEGDTGGATDTQEGDAGPADQQSETPKQTPEQDRAFAEMRRQAEAAQRRAQLADQLIAQQYGQSHGIYTVEQYYEALRQQQEAEQRQQYLEQGVDPDLVNQLVSQQVQQHPLIQTLAQERADKFLVDSYNQVVQEFPDLVKQPEDIPPEAYAKWNDGRNGITLAEAFMLVNKDKVLQRKTAAAKQAALNSVNSKGHIRGSGGGADVETVTIPEETLEMYKRLNPGKSMEEYQRHYKKSIGR